MEKRLIRIGNEDYDTQSDSLSLGGSLSELINEKEILSQLTHFHHLKSLDLNYSELNDKGLELLSTLPISTQIEDLSLQGIEISDAGVKCLKAFKKLNSLRLKDNPQLTNKSISYLLAVPSLQIVHLGSMSIDQEGLSKLAENKNFKMIVLEDWKKGKITYDGLLQLSLKLPECTIIAKPRAEFCNGEFSGKWAD